MVQLLGDNYTLVWIVDLLEFEVSMDGFLLFIVFLSVAVFVVAIASSNSNSQNKSPDVEKMEQYGAISPAMICPHCQIKGKIRTKSVTQKKGVSGGKATAALLTGGVSLLATGLSRKEGATQAHCGECGNTWVY